MGVLCVLVNGELGCNKVLPLQHSIQFNGVYTMYQYEDLIEKFAGKKRHVVVFC